MKKPIGGAAAIVAVVIVVILAVLFGYRSLVAQPKLDYPAGFNPATRANTKR